jgi:hypothetical protein
MFMKCRKDGGPDSRVWGYWLVEIKSLFSIALLRFEDGSREAYHSHAFNSVSLVLSGRLMEVFEDRLGMLEHTAGHVVVTRRSDFHKVHSIGRTWVLTFRGPWSDTWHERTADGYHTLSHGRRVVESRPHR